MGHHSEIERGTHLLPAKAGKTARSERAEHNADRPQAGSGKGAQTKRNGGARLARRHKAQGHANSSDVSSPGGAFLLSRKSHAGVHRTQAKTCAHGQGLTNRENY